MKCLTAAMLLAITLPAEAGIAVRAWGGVNKQGADLIVLTNAQRRGSQITGL